MKAFPPGVFIRDEIYEREWTDDEFAAKAGWDMSLLRDIINGVEPLALEYAEDIAEVFGTSVALWTNLEAMYRLSRD